MSLSDQQPIGVLARLRPGRGVLVAAVLLNAAVLVVGSTIAAFSGRATVQQPNTSGSVSIVLDAAGKAAVEAGVTGLGSGDWFERAITVSAGTGLPVGSWALSTSASPSSALDTTATHGLRLKVESCDTPWTVADSGGVKTHSCSTRKVVVEERDIRVTDQPLSGLGTSTVHLLLTVKLADSAPDTLQSLSSTIAYTFVGVQRAGQAR